MINAEIIKFVQTKFGVTLKDKQLHIINMLCESPHKNVFAFWPTGFGKSMLYILPPMLQDEVTVACVVIKLHELQVITSTIHRTTNCLQTPLYHAVC